VVVVGFVLRFNPVLVVVVAGLVSGVLAKIALPDLLALLGRSFIENRPLLLFLLTLPAIGVLERHGLRERASSWIAGFRKLTLARVLIAYLGLRQLTSIAGLTPDARHAQTVRPRGAPRSEAAAGKDLGELSQGQRNDIRAMAAATDNIGLFFGEDVFVAIGGVLLIQGFYARNGIDLEPLTIALWALPTAAAAFVIQSVRVWRFQRALSRTPERSEDRGPAHAAD
jgi:uncharacterized membrane protein